MIFRIMEAVHNVLMIDMNAEVVKDVFMLVQQLEVQRIEKILSGEIIFIKYFKYKENQNEN